MKNLKAIVFAIVAFAMSAVITNAAVVYDASGNGGSGTTYLSDFNGQFQVSYYDSEWSAYYDDFGVAQYSYTLYSTSGTYSVFAAFGGPPPPPGFPPSTGWSFISYHTDNLSNSPPAFLNDFWLVAPQ
jgi:hypothetical protein